MSPNCGKMDWADMHRHCQIFCCALFDAFTACCDRTVALNMMFAREMCETTGAPSQLDVDHAHSLMLALKSLCLPVVCTLCNELQLQPYLPMPAAVSMIWMDHDLDGP